ncbi:MAG: DNRLRE domain-containing protein [Ruminococcaceae bacterium]|nr:DNRLRE domain-containing protein [Oscillospiraceae bacterium]
MKKSTKILSLILSVLTLLSVFSVATPVFAAEVTSESTETIDDMTISSEETEETEQAEIVSEIEDMRTEHTKYFRMSDGSYMAAQYAQPVHYEENGEWKEYDYSITEDENEFVIENSDSEMSFPEEFSEDNEAQIEVSAREYDIKFSPVLDKKIFSDSKKQKGKVKDHKELKSNKIIEEFTEEAPIDESADKNSEKLKIDNQKSAIAYEEVYSNVDLEYEISSNQIKESIVLNSKQDKEKFEFTLDTDGLFPKKETDGSITLYEDKECTKPVSSIMKPYMYDAEGAYSYDVTMDIKEKKGIYTLTVKASNNWLNDKARKYPVVIDPTIELDVGRTNTTDTYVDNSAPNSTYFNDYFIYAGYNSLGKTRTFVKFKLPAIPDKCSVITNATVSFCQYEADLVNAPGYLNLHNITSEWEAGGSVTWSNQKPTYNKNVVLDYAQIKTGNGVWYNFDITKSVKSWYQGEANYGLALVSSNESVANRVRLYSAQNYTAAIYPQITVSYLNNKGLEDYWSYSSYANGAAGAAYINDYTGNLVYELPILSSISDLMPLNLVAYYNTYSANVKLNVGKSDSSRTTVAKGFKLNVQQTVLPSSQYDLRGEDAEKYPYVYTDGDGTEHYIQKTTEDGKTVYKAEDNEDITLSLTPDIDCKYQIIFKDGTDYYFNSKGNLGRIQDANGNKITISYKAADATNELEEKTRISKITDGAGHTFTFTYYKSNGKELDYIKTITDNAGRTVEFTTKNGFLRTVKYFDSTESNLYYQLESTEGLLDFVQDENGYGLNFDYTPEVKERKIKQVCEYIHINGKNTVAQRVTFDYSKYNTTVVRSAGIDGIHGSITPANGKDDIITTVQFDNAGKAISQQVSLGSGDEIGAGVCSFTNEATGVGEQNKISSSASLGKNTVNLLSNGNAETTSSWTQKANDSVTSSTGNATTCYIGKKSLKIQNTKFSDDGVSYYRQNISSPTVSETYTLSAYVRADALTEKYNTTNKGAYIQLAAYNSANTPLKTVYSEKITAKTDTAVNNGWRRITVSIEIPANTTTLSSYLCLRDMTGAVYFDCIQLEKSDTANSYNMLENSSFEKHSSGSPSLWSKAGDFVVTTNSSGSVTEGVNAPANPKDGANCLRIDGDALKSKGVSQSIPVASNENDTYIVSGWANANAVNDTFHQNSAGKAKTKFEILPRVYYTCTDSSGTETQVYQDKDPAIFNTTISGWQYSAVSFSLKYTNPESGKTYTPKSILIVPRYCYQENFAYFDHLQLIKDEGQTHTYTYDKEGNVVLTAVNSEQKVNTKYDKNNDLTEYTDTAGYKTTATYDNCHNLETVKSPRGVVTRNTYWENGISETTEIQNSNGSAAIKTTTGISTDNSSYIEQTSDQHGYITSYKRDPATGVITEISAPNDVVTYNKYNSNLTIPMGVETDGTSVDYSYNGNRLANIFYSGIDGRSETYGFKYDDFGNTTSVTVNNKPLSTKTYGTNNGPLKSSVYGNNDSVAYNYNKLGLVSSIVKSDIETVKTSTGATTTTTTTSDYSWTYTSTGVKQSHTDSVNNRKFLYDYDSLGRLIRQEIQNSTNNTHIGGVEFGYDIRSNLTKVATEIGGYTAVDKYLYSEDSGNANAASYARDNLLSRYYITNSTSRYVDYFYDSLNRLNKKSLSLGTTINCDYAYKTAVVYNEGLTDKKYKTTQLGREILDNTAYSYYYDKVGNVTDIKLSTRSALDTISEHKKYTYDSKNQLLSETITKKDVNNNSVTTKTTFEYDDIGNISKKKLTVGTNTTTVIYNYGKDTNAGWNHILTSVDLNGNSEISENEKIRYDAIGNPTKYLGASLTWNGRELTSYSGTVDGKATNVTYTYDSDGLRTTKDNNGEKSTYYYVGGQLRYETRGNLKFYYFYDASGNLSAIRYYPANSTDGYMYYPLTNSRGDVVSIYNSSGTPVVTYEYDAWGNCTIVSDTSGRNIGELNPIRYRGYYYDSETKLYYLQSRYYDPEVGRFLNADGYVSTGQGATSYNMFAYCGNNPVMRSDPSGRSFLLALGLTLFSIAFVSSVSIVGIVHVEQQRQKANEKYNSETVNVYVPGEGSKKDDSVNVCIDKNHPSGMRDSLDPNIRIYDSLDITNRYEQEAIIDVIMSSPHYDNTVFTRTKESYVKEWRAHNAYDFVIPWDISEHTGEVDLNFDDPYRLIYELWVF